MPLTMSQLKITEIIIILGDTKGLLRTLQLRTSVGRKEARNRPPPPHLFKKINNWQIAEIELYLLE